MLFISSCDNKIRTTGRSPDWILRKLGRIVNPAEFPHLELDVGSQYTGYKNGDALSLFWSSAGIHFLEKFFGTLDKYRLFLIGDIVCGQTKCVEAIDGVLEGKLVGEGEEQFTILGANIYSTAKNSVQKGPYKAFASMNVVENLFSLKPGIRYQSAVEDVIRKVDQQIEKLYAHLEQLKTTSHGVRLEVTVPWHQLNECFIFLRRLWWTLSELPGMIHAVDKTEIHSYLVLQSRMFYLPVKTNLDLLLRTQAAPNTMDTMREALLTVVVFLDLLSGVFWTGCTFGHAQKFIFNRPSLESPCTLDGRRSVRVYNYLVFCWVGGGIDPDGPFDAVTLRFKTGWVGMYEFAKAFESIVRSSALSLPPRAAAEAHILMQATSYVGRAKFDIHMMAVITILCYNRYVSDLMGFKSFQEERLLSKMCLNRVDMEEMEEFADVELEFIETDIAVDALLSTRLTSLTNGIKKNSALGQIIAKFEAMVKDHRRRGVIDCSASVILARAYIALGLNVLHGIGNGRTYLGSRTQFIYVRSPRITRREELVQEYDPPSREELDQIKAEEAEIIQNGPNLPWTELEKFAVVLASLLPSCRQSAGKVDWGRVKIMFPMFDARRSRKALSGQMKNSRNIPELGRSFEEIRAMFLEVGLNTSDGFPDDFGMSRAALMRFFRAWRPPRLGPEFDIPALRAQAAIFLGGNAPREGLRGPPMDVQPFVFPVPEPRPRLNQEPVPLGCFCLVMPNIRPLEFAHLYPRHDESDFESGSGSEEEGSSSYRSSENEESDEDEGSISSGGSHLAVSDETESSFEEDEGSESDDLNEVNLHYSGNDQDSDVDFIYGNNLGIFENDAVIEQYLALRAQPVQHQLQDGELQGPIAHGQVLVNVEHIRADEQNQPDEPEEAFRQDESSLSQGSSGGPSLFDRREYEVLMDDDYGAYNLENDDRSYDLPWRTGNLNISSSCLLILISRCYHPR